MTNKTAVRDIDPIEIEKFKKTLSNEATTFMPNDEGYEEAITRWAENARMKAGLIVKVFTLEDITATVNFARKHGCDFAVLGGGHSPAGYSSSKGGIVLDMRKRNKVQVDTEQKLVHVQAGAIWRDVYKATWEHGLAVVGGSVDCVGVGGLTLGGGIGLLTAKHGMSIDNLVGATIVLADGSVKQLSSKSNEDLFWAIRGAGPNFGVATDLIFKAHPQPNEVVAGFLVFPTEKLQGIIEATNYWLSNRQPDEDALLFIGRTPPDFEERIAILAFLNDPSHENFRARFSSFYKLDPIADSSRPMTFPEANSIQNDAIRLGSRKAFTSGHVSAPLKISTFQSVLNAYLDYVPSSGDGLYGAVIFEFHNHDNTFNVLSNATAYPHRKKVYQVAIVQQWKDENDDEDCLKWLKRVSNLINQDYSPNTISLNFNGPNLIKDNGDVILEDDVNPKDVYGDNLERLKELKAKYDPTIFFDKGVVIRP